MTGLKYPFPAYGFFQKKKKLKTWRNINNPHFFPTCEPLCNCEILPDRSYSLVHSFCLLPRTDGAAAGGSERDGADRGAMCNAITWWAQAKESGETVFKSELIEVQATLTMRQHTMDSRFPLTGKWKIALAHKEGLCGLRVWRPGQRPEENLFIFKCRSQSVSNSAFNHPRYHREKGKSVKTAGSLRRLQLSGPASDTLSMRLSWLPWAVAVSCPPAEKGWGLPGDKAECVCVCMCECIRVCYVYMCK